MPKSGMWLDWECECLVSAYFHISINITKETKVKGKHLWQAIEKDFNRRADQIWAEREKRDIKIWFIGKKALETRYCRKASDIRNIWTKIQQSCAEYWEIYDRLKSNTNSPSQHSEEVIRKLAENEYLKQCKENGRPEKHFRFRNCMDLISARETWLEALMKSHHQQRSYRGKRKYSADSEDLDEDEEENESLDDEVRSLPPRQPVTNKKVCDVLAENRSNLANKSLSVGSYLQAHNSREMSNEVPRKLAKLEPSFANKNFGIDMSGYAGTSDTWNFKEVQERLLLQYRLNLQYNMANSVPQLMKDNSIAGIAEVLLALQSS